MALPIRLLKCALDQGVWERIVSLDDMKRLVRQHIDLSWNKGRLALAEQLQSKDFLYKSSFISRPFNSATYCRMVQNIREAMPDLEVVVEECIAEGNKVVTWSTLIGSIQKPALGYPPSDKILSISAMAFWTFNSLGEVQEICTMFDMESFRAQQGLSTQHLAEKALP
ncbi:SnoaL-like polyketide cyclase [compost metagenome]